MSKTPMSLGEINIALLEMRNEAGADQVSSKALQAGLKKYGVHPTGWAWDASRKAGRGLWSLKPLTGLKIAARASRPAKASIPKPESAIAAMQLPATVAPAAVDNVIPFRNTMLHQRPDNLVPAKMPTYVPFGAYHDVEMIIESKIFYPVFITGLSGNGKTVMIEQACARLGRNCVRVNITEETDEDDLIGGNTLVDGNVVYREGPVLMAMRTGSVLILDEVDLNATKILCLQAIMEGSAYFNKKTGETIYPQPGFNVFATANTKGRGSETGRFIGTKIMNEAFLERFPITYEQEYPSLNVEQKILNKNLEVLGIRTPDNEMFVTNLTKWSDVIRQSYANHAVEDLISTRRLVAIVKAFAIFTDRQKAVQVCLARFDEDTKAVFMELYLKIDPNLGKPAPNDANLNAVNEPSEFADLDSNGNPIHY